MAKYQQQNSGVIKKSFARLQSHQQEITLHGVIELAKFGLAMLEKHHLESENVGGETAAHITDDNTMAYAVAHNGKVLASGHTEGDNDFPSDVSQVVGQAEDYAREYSAMESGPFTWVIVLFSQMEGWYRWSDEMSFYYATRYDIQKNFGRYFKPIDK